MTSTQQMHLHLFQRNAKELLRAVQENRSLKQTMIELQKRLHYMHASIKRAGKGSPKQRAFRRIQIGTKRLFRLLDLGSPLCVLEAEIGLLHRYVEDLRQILISKLPRLDYARKQALRELQHLELVASDNK